VSLFIERATEIEGDGERAFEQCQGEKTSLIISPLVFAKNRPSFSGIKIPFNYSKLENLKLQNRDRSF
jgi:hypothetical protein